MTRLSRNRRLHSLSELMVGYDFLDQDLGADVRAYAAHFLRTRPPVTAERDARHAIGMLRRDQDLAAVRKAVECIERVLRSEEFIDQTLEDARLRFRYYAGCMGCPESAGVVAAESAHRAESFWLSGAAEVPYLIKAAIGWLLVSVGDRSDPNTVAGEARRAAMVHGERVVRRLFERHESAATTPAPAHQEKRVFVQGDSADEGSADQADTQPEPGVVVIAEFGNRSTSEGKRAASAYEGLTGARLPTVPLPDLSAARARLLIEFPFAQDVADSILADLSGRPDVWFRPTIFVGPAGCGKTSFAQTLLDTVGVRHETFSCGGVSDAGLGGTPRRWSTGEPSLPVALVQRWGTASPAIVLDEIEKVGTSRHNGNLLDVLLGLLETRSSQRWHDPYIEAPVDLSHVIWLGTANSLTGLPGPLLDRFRVLRFPEPGSEHLRSLSSNLLRRLAEQRGLDARWGYPLAPHEMEAVAAVWSGGSIRSLSRLLEAVLDARGRGGLVQ